MSVTQPGKAEPRPSPGLTLNLSSNNPFRNRAASPNLSPGLPSPLDPSPRPVSRNPFLDVNYTNNSPQIIASPDAMSATTSSAPPRPALSSNAADLFDKLTLDEKPKPKPSNGTMRPPPRSNTDGVPPPYSTGLPGSRRENIPPPRGPPGHRPTRSQEEAMRARKAASGSRSRPSGELNIFADPSDSPEKRSESRRRPRRNSESSVASKTLDSEEERKRHERRRRERKLREAKDKDGRPRKPERKLDVIDKLDVTSIYGTGLFHHDGPFDACNPHRNRQGSKRAPMSAFAKDSLNNVLGGGGPLNKRPDHATFLGNNDDEAFKDYSKGGISQNGYESYNDPMRPKPSRQESNVQSALSKVEPVHGEESLGLGTSTFLEGAPASRTAMQRKESEQAILTEGGLGRKKSLAQKIRGVGNSRRDYAPRVTSPGVISPGITSPNTPAFTPGGTEINNNPFFSEFAKGDDGAVKKESLTFSEPLKSPRAEVPGSPKRGLERRLTGEGSSSVEQPTKSSVGTGFLARVKSLKGGPRKPRDRPLPQPQALDA